MPASTVLSKASRNVLGSILLPSASALLTSNYYNNNINNSNNKKDHWDDNTAATTRHDFTTRRTKSLHSVSFCEEAVKNKKSDEENMDKKDGMSVYEKEVVLQKRMTPIGRFSLKTETDTNPSVPTVFIALSSNYPPTNSNLNSSKSSNNNPTKTNATTTTTPTTNTTTSLEHNVIVPTYFHPEHNNVMTVSEFISTWYKRNMPILHPRYHFKVSTTKDGHFDSSSSEPKNQNNPKDDTIHLSDHVSETLHMQTYRQDLKKRIEELVSTTMDVKDKLWHVQISSGELGSSGAISKQKVEQIKNHQQQQQPLKETILLFKCHHALADGVTLTASLSDLLDEAQDIREKIEIELKKRKMKSKELKWWQRLLQIVQKLIWFLLGSMYAICHHMYLTLTTRKNPFLLVLQEDSAANLACGRSISWCDVASVEDVTMVAKKIGGKSATINDVFVSCVSAAISRQLAQHKERIHLMNNSDSSNNNNHDVVAKTSHETNIQNINVVIPAHLAGGIIPPGKSVGNLIGAFVTRVPCEMKSGSTSSNRFMEVHHSLSKSKKSPAPILSYLMARFVAQYVPEQLAVHFFHNSSANAAVAITNGRGPEQKVHINGKPIEATVGFLPLPPNIPVGVVVSSYDSTISLSVNAEKWAVPDADLFLSWVLEEYKILCVEASK